MNEPNSTGRGEATAGRWESSRGGALARGGESETVPELRGPFVLSHYERGQDGRKRPVYEYQARLGKPRGEIIRYLVVHGGQATVGELMERFAGERTRPRDFKRRRLADLAGYVRAYKSAPLEVGPAIITVEDGVVRLVPGWREAVEVRRELGGEQDAAIRQKADHLRQRAAYRARLKAEADPAPSRDDMDARCAERERLRQQADGEIDELVRVEDPACAPEVEDPQAEIAALVAAGMSPAWAAAEVDPGDLAVLMAEPPESEAETHDLSCECLNCSASPPRYVTATRGAA